MTHTTANDIKVQHERIAMLAADPDSRAAVLASAAVALAEMEGYVATRVRLDRALEHGGVEQGRTVALQILTTQDEGTWSGLGNDVRRSEAAGVRKCIEDALWGDLYVSSKEG